MQNDDEFDPSELNWSHPHAAEIEELEKQINGHPGNRLANRLNKLRRILDAWVGFSTSLVELLRKCEHEEEFAVELMRNVGDQSKRAVIVRSLDQATIAYVAGLGAVIDHTRSVVDKQRDAVKAEYAEGTARLVAEHPAAPFLGKLRNYILHNVAAPWEFSGTFEEHVTISVSMNSAALLENKKAWTPDAKAFIMAAGESIQLSPPLQPYMEAMVAHIKSIFPAVVRDNLDILNDCDALIKKRNLLLTGGVTDGIDWELRMEHMAENMRRLERGEPQTDFRTGQPIAEDDPPEPSL